MNVIKTGADHLHSLRDGRQVIIDGAVVADVTTHPAFRHAVASACRLYDVQAADPELMTFAPAGGARRIGRAWQRPTSREELALRRRALTVSAETHFGFMGRSPDHVASCLAGQMMGLGVFERHGPARARALRDYFEHASRSDLYLTYVIINPQADRGRAWGEQAPDLVARIVDEDSGGITLRGAKMLGTGAVLANEVLVASLQPLQPGEEDIAFSCALPLNTPGLRILSRKSYEAGAARFDNPLAWQYDENDAVIHFEDVKVPWDRVFVYRDTDMCRAQFHDTPAHILQNHQAQIRLAVKLRFLVGVAKRLTEVIGTGTMPQVREQLGRLAAQAAMVDAMLHGMEGAGEMRDGYFLPPRHFVYAAQVLTQEMYPKVIETLRSLAGGAMIMLPSSEADFSHPVAASIIARTQRSAVAAPLERVKFLKAAWDAVGSEFASRHLQYEMFYAGAPFVTCAHSLRTYDWPGATAMVDRLTSAYDVQTSGLAGVEGAAPLASP